MLGKVNGRWGMCTYFLKDTYVGRSIHNYGEYGPDETEKILELRGSGLFLDVGANIGCISQAVISDGGDVVAFEPQLEVYNVLKENLINAYFASNKGSWTAHNCAVGSSNDIVKMEVLDYFRKNNIGGHELGTRNPWGKHRDVEVVALDNTALENVSFIKIDVEGFELEVLKGAIELIKRDKPILYVEDDRPHNSYGLRRFIREELGYWIEEHKPTLFRSDNFFGKKENVWDRNYASHNLICRPC
jgi:FkbM family methyltransferase